jgi:hypothetical protein
MLFEEYLCNIPLLHSWDGGATWNTGGFDRQHLEKLFLFLRDRLPDHPVFLRQVLVIQRLLCCSFNPRS